MRNAMPRVDHVGVYVDDTLRVPVPVVADTPIPRDHLTARYEGVAWAPVSAGVPARAVPTVIAGSPERVGLSGSGGQTQTGQAQTARQPRQQLRTAKVGSWLVPFARRHRAGVGGAVK
jgi:hypothetical protein